VSKDVTIIESDAPLQAYYVAPRDERLALRFRDLSDADLEAMQKGLPASAPASVCARHMGDVEWELKRRKAARN
jgi:hypothetical protein